MSFLARLSLANRGLVAIIAIVVLGFGAIAIPSLKQQLIPTIDFPAAFVLAPYPGVSPDIVEEQVTAPIENALQGVPGLTDITSTTREGVATVQVSFEFGSSIDDITNKIQTAINRIKSTLPSTVEPQVIAGTTDLTAGRGARRQQVRRPGRVRTAARRHRRARAAGDRGRPRRRGHRRGDAGRGDHARPGEGVPGRGRRPDGDRRAQVQRRVVPRRHPDRGRPFPGGAGRRHPRHPGRPQGAQRHADHEARRRREGRAQDRRHHLDHPHQRQGQPRHRGHRVARRQRGEDQPRGAGQARRPQEGARRRRGITSIFDQAPFVESPSRASAPRAPSACSSPSW